MTKLENTLNRLICNYGVYLQEDNDFCSFRTFIKKSMGRDWLNQIKELTKFTDEHEIVRQIDKIETYLKYFNHGSTLLIR